VCVIAVTLSRICLADHYPLDVLGGILCALAAAFIGISAGRLA
jgi:membrane-associated phospholipid phosphatase